MRYNLDLKAHLANAQRRRLSFLDFHGASALQLNDQLPKADWSFVTSVRWYRYWASDRLDEVLSNFPNLAKLNLGGEPLSIQDAASIVQRCPSLTGLDFSSARLISLEVIQYLVERLPHLRELDLSALGLTVDIIPVLVRKAPGLRSLALGECERFTSRDLDCISACFPLDSLNLAACNLNDEDAALITRRLPKLHTLGVSACTNITPTGLTTLVTGLHSLTNLWLLDCQVTDSVVATIVKQLPKLKSLNINWCKQVSESAVELVVERLEYLDCLSAAITDRHMHAIGRGLPLLTWLTTGRTNQVTDEGVRASMTPARRFEGLDFRLCEDVTDESLATISTSSSSSSLEFLGLNFRGVKGVPKDMLDTCDAQAIIGHWRNRQGRVASEPIPSLPDPSKEFWRLPDSSVDIADPNVG